MGETWERFLTLVGLGFWIFDFVTDIGTLISYWRRQSTTIAVLATTSMVLSTLVGLLLLYYVWKVVKEGERHDDGDIITWKGIEALVESIPQLAINLYVLSICGQSTTAIQNVSTVDPNYTVRNISTTLNTSEFESHIPTEEPPYVSTGMPFAGSQDIPTIQHVSAAASFIGICVGLVSSDKLDSEEEGAPFDWLETVLLFTTKAFAIIARMFILVYFAFFLGWWTAIFPVVHSTCSVILIFIIVRDLKFADFNPCHSCENIVYLVTVVVLYLFVWVEHDDSKWATISFAILYSVENIVLLVISLNVKIYFDEYCLYSNVLWVNVGLNLACLGFALMFTYKIRRKNEALERKTRQIELWTSVTVQEVTNDFSQCFFSLRQRFTNILGSDDGCTTTTNDEDDESNSRDAPSGDCVESGSESVNDESNQSAKISENDYLVEHETEV